ncbi:MAG: glycoside hydrolase family 44 protein [Isosphaerales bacterium]
MMHVRRTIAVMAILIGLSGATTCAGEVSGWTGEEPAAAKPYAVRVTIDARKPLHAISPLIYGASAVEPARAKGLGISAVRWGGNRSSRYNWKTRADNAGSDWFFLNGKSGRWSDFLGENRRAGLSSYLTVPMLPWVAKGPEGWGFSVAKYGPQRKVEQYVADRGDGTSQGGAPIVGNDPLDTSVQATPEFQAEGIRALPHDPKRPTIYALDNEPMLWQATHRDVFPRGLSYEECLDRGVALAKAIKGADPSGLVAGPCTWGWTDLMYSAADAGGDNYATHADRKAHGDKPFLAWYLAGMKSASRREGKRLLDYVDIHFYPQGQADGQGVYAGTSHSRAMRSLRLRSTRGLWDPSYRDESWIGEPVALIPRVRSWVANENPGTRLAIGEYSWGGDDDASGAIAQVEVLGIFGRANVDAAFFWAGMSGVQRFAFQLYRNPDGSRKGFGQRALACQSNTPDRLGAFAAIREDGALTVVLANKDLDCPAEVRLETVDGRVSKPGGTIFRLPNPPGSIRKEPLAADARRIVVPPLSAAMIVKP